MVNNFPLSGLLNGFFAVDTFFVISGTLTTYMIIKSTKRVFKNFNLFIFIILRYLRLTPGIIFSMLSFFLLPILSRYFGNSPFSTEIIKPEIDNCKYHWLANLFYLQTNILNEDSSSICIIPSWWLSVEMKLHFLSIIVIVLLFLRPKLSFLIGLFIVIFSIIWSFLDHFDNNYVPFPVQNIPQIELVCSFYC